MVARCIQAFGPHGSYYLGGPTFNRWNGLPSALATRLTDGTIVHVHHLCLLPNGGFFVTYRNNANGDWALWEGLPLALERWLSMTDATGTPTRDVAHIRLTVGPNESYYVHDTKSFQWSNLPAGLETAINRARNARGSFDSTPRLVSLGPRGMYVMVGARNDLAWDLQGHLPQLHGWLSGRRDVSNFQDVAFHPSDENVYSIHMSHGRESSLMYAVPGHLTDFNPFVAEVRDEGVRLGSLHSPRPTPPMPSPQPEYRHSHQPTPSLHSAHTQAPPPPRPPAAASNSSQMSSSFWSGVGEGVVQFATAAALADGGGGGS